MLPSWMHRDFRWNGRRFFSSSELLEFTRENCPEASDFLASWMDGAGMIAVNTSGSTGKPKEILLEREKMIASAKATGNFFALHAGSRVLLCLPLQYIAGKMMLVRAMTLGWELYSNFPVVEIRVEENQYFDFAAMVPLQLSKNLGVLGNLKIVLLGGGQVSSELEDLVQDSSCRVYLGYGMTETITHVAIRPLNVPAGLDGSREHYKALPGIGFKTDDRGCLVISAPRISTEDIVTNDLVELLSETSFRWLARYDNIINSGGIKLLPELIEKKLRPMVGREFFVFGLEDEVLGQRLVMMVEGEASDLQKKLKQFQEENPNLLARHELPKEIFFIPSMTRTETGKIHRKAAIKKIGEA